MNRRAFKAMVFKGFRELVTCYEKASGSQRNRPDFQDDASNAEGRRSPRPDGPLSRHCLVSHESFSSQPVCLVPDSRLFPATSIRGASRGTLAPLIRARPATLDARRPTFTGFGGAWRSLHQSNVRDHLPPCRDGTSPTDCPEDPYLGPEVAFFKTSLVEPSFLRRPASGIVRSEQRLFDRFWIQA